MTKRALLYFDIYLSFRNVLSPCMFLRLSSLKRRSWQQKQESNSVTVTPFSGLNGKMILVELCFFLGLLQKQKRKFLWLCQLYKCSHLSVYTFVLNQYNELGYDVGLRMSIAGGHKKIWWYYYKKHEANILLLKYMYFAYSSGHLHICKYFYSKLSNYFATKFLADVCESSYEDMNQFIHEEKERLKI